MNTNIKPKFTATLVTENDKNLIVALRNETNLSEKELMTLVIAKAIEHKSSILELAVKINEANRISSDERKVVAYEALKLKLAAARAAVTATKPTVPDKPPVAEKPAVAKTPAKKKPAKSSEAAAVAA